MINDNLVIFATRYAYKNSERYRIIPDDYTQLYHNINNDEIVKEIFSKYISYDNSLNLNQNLYNLLSEDSNTNDFFHKTKLSVCVHIVKKFL